MREKLFPIVILAGGLATRLRPTYATMPKSLIPIQGKPFIHYQLTLLAKSGFNEVIICVGHLGDAIEKYLGNGDRYQLQIHYSYDGPVLLGTGGALRKALPLIRDNFFVMYGDSYLPCSYYDIQNKFVSEESLGLMTVFKNQGLWDKSNIEFADGKILMYDKNVITQTLQYIDYGLGVLSKKAFEDIPIDQAFDLATLYQRLLGHNQLSAFEIHERFFEIGSFAGIKDFEYYLSQLAQTA